MFHKHLLKLSLLVGLTTDLNAFSPVGLCSFSLILPAEFHFTLWFLICNLDSSMILLFFLCHNKKISLSSQLFILDSNEAELRIH